MANRVIFISLALVAVAQPAGQPSWPKWASDNLKDLWSEADGITAKESKAVTPELCQLRMQIFQELKGSTGDGVSYFRHQVLNELSMCSLDEGKFSEAAKRLDFCLSELDSPDDNVLNHMSLGHLPLAKKAVRLLQDGYVEAAMVEIRRLKTVVNRYIKKILDMSLKEQFKQIFGSNPDKKKEVLEATNGALPSSEHYSEEERAAMLKRQRQGMLTAGWLDIAEKLLSKSDDALLGASAEKRDKRFRLFVPKEKVDLEHIAKGGKPELKTEPFPSQKFYIHALDVERFFSPDSCQKKFSSVLDILKLGDQLKDHAVKVGKSVTLFNGHKKGDGCSLMTEFCDSLESLPDFATNVFGESRLIALKRKKKESVSTSAIAMCRANAHLTVVLPVQVPEGASASVMIGDGQNEQVEVLKPMEPVVVDHCLNVEFQADYTAAETTNQVLLFVAQFWHPEVSLIERTTFARLAETDKDKQKTLAKAINNSKTAWEAANALYRKNAAKIKLVWSGQGVEKTEKKIPEKEKPEKKKDKKKPPPAAPRKEKESDPEIAALLALRDEKRDEKRNSAAVGDMAQSSKLNKEINEIERTINKKRKKAAKRAKREAKENLTKEAKENMATQEAKERAKAEEL